MMAYWVNLDSLDTGKNVEVPICREGREVKTDGPYIAETFISHDFDPYFQELIDKELGLLWLDGQKAGDTLQKLHEAAWHLGADLKDAWERKSGRVGLKLQMLIIWAAMYPNAVWSVRGIKS